MTRVGALAREFMHIVREGTWAGTLRYVRFKRIGSRVNRQTFIGKGPDCGMGIVGAGTYAASVHLPCLQAHGVPIYAIASRSGDTAVSLARVYGITKVHEIPDAMFADEHCDGFLIATPHNLHPEHILKALDSGRYTYCEKPVAIDADGLVKLVSRGLAHANASRIMIGFNRRFAPAIRNLRPQVWLWRRQQPLEINYRVNYGPRVNNAMNDPAVGGGRVHGAACHYVDMIAFLAGVQITRVSAVAITRGDGPDENTFSACMHLADGSVASLSFTSEGRREFGSKEEVLVTCEGHVARVTDYCELHVDGRQRHYYRHRYGAMGATGAFLAARLSGKPVPVSIADGVAATRVTLAIQESIRHGGAPVDVPVTQGALCTTLD